MRGDRFHDSWAGGRSTVRHQLVQCVHYDTVNEHISRSTVERLGMEVIRQRSRNYSRY
jgi:hypothetical protein